MRRSPEGRSDRLDKPVLPLGPRRQVQPPAVVIEQELGAEAVYGGSGAFPVLRG
jgi:hypothetical protein